MSIEDLAADARLHYTTVSRIENGKQSPTWRAVRKLAWALEVEIADLARLAAKQPMSSPEPL